MLDYLPFVDISYANGNYDMAANTDQIIAIRMSSGDGGLHFDTQATTNYNAASKAGKVIINYHFAGLGDPTTEAKFFIEAVSPFSENDVYCLDHEMGQSAAWCQTFCEYVHSVTGAWPLDYEDISLANSMGVVPNCGLWLAAPSYGFDQGITELSSSIEYVAQQGPIVNGVDSDAWFGTLDQLKAYGYHATTALPVTPTPVVATPVEAPTPTVAPVTTPTPIPVTAPTTTTTVPVTVTPTPVTPVTTTTPVDPVSVPPAGTTVPPSSAPVVSTIENDVNFVQTIVNFFKGKKTYLAAVIMVLTSAEKYFTGDHTLSQYITTVQGLFGSIGVLAVTIRAAISKNNP